jgi:glycosyltransferase involved in cell wall biosynthesis
MARVVMFVYNDVRTDARVLREAAALADVGHDVTVIGRPTNPTSRVGDTERRGAVTIIRVPIPAGWRILVAFLRHPWRLARWIGLRILGGLKTLPGGIGELLLGVGVGLAAIPWSIVRLPLFLLDRALGRKAPPGGSIVDWLIRWRWATLGWASGAAAAAGPADVYHGHDLTGLPAAVRAQERNGGRVVYDSHEIFLESGTNATRPRWLKRFFARLERRWAARASGIVTVNEALAHELRSRLGARDVTVVHNCPPRWTPPAELADQLRPAAGIPAGTPLALYHGGFSAHRGLEQLAEAILVPGMEDVHAAYLGYGGMRADLDGMAADPRFGGRLHVIDAVPPDQLVEMVAGADVDVMALQPSTLNHYLSTPNKLFESLAAGVPVIASDFPDLHRIVIDNPGGPLGEVCDPGDPASIAAAIRRVLDAPAPARLALRARCLAAAHDRWNWEHESAALVALYSALTAGSAPA